MVKVLQTSANLPEKMGNTAVMGKAGARSLEGVSSIQNQLGELRQVLEALWPLCFNLENGSKKSEKGYVLGQHREGSSPPSQGAGSIGTQRKARTCRSCSPRAVHYPLWLAAICVSASTPWEESGRLQAELRNQISQASAFPSSPLAKESSSRPRTNSYLV